MGMDGVRPRTLPGKKVNVRATDGSNVLVTVRVGNQCMHATMTLRAKGKALVFP